jgi:hypothetical protein
MSIGRPLGEVASRALDLAAERPVTYMDVATVLQLSRRDASVTLYRLAAAGRVVEEGRVTLEAARKPVPVYRASEPAPPPAILILDWPR